MYAKTQERLVGSVGTAMVVGALGYMLLVGMRVDQRFHIEEPITLLAIQPPRPVPPVQKPHVITPKANKPSAHASPRNLKNKAAEIVKPPPPPVVIPLPPPPVIAAPKAGLGMAASAGASDRPGPGQGAGGQGMGNGSGGSGDGEGSGDESPPRLKKGKLKFADLPPDLREGGIGGTVAVRYNVGTDGRVSNCVATASSGNRELDQITCRLIEDRFIYAPSRDANRKPVPSIIEESHSWIVTEGDDTR